MNGKGDKRRPQNITEAELAERWALAFTKEEEEEMPVQSCQKEGKPGYKCGKEGKCYTYTAGNKQEREKAKKQAIDQCIAMGEKP